jgi:hypothetical protein
MTDLEDVNFLRRDLAPAEAANELLALAAEHAAGDHLNPAVVRCLSDDVHARVARIVTAAQFCF